MKSALAAMFFSGAVVCASPLAASPEGRAPVLRLPIDCRLGTSCFIQQYVDHDPGPNAKDYRCGPRTYDGHDGTDFRLPTIAAQQRGVAVLAAADGTVHATRNDSADHLVASAADRMAISGKECGNGVLIDHADGWTTQYCHMAKGSVSVTPGQRVRAGDRLGLVGLSGDTQFPHLHIGVRHGAIKIDPFAPDLESGACRANAGGNSLWADDLAGPLAYHATEIINVGFAGSPPRGEAVDAESVQALTAGSDAMVFFGRAIGLRKGDVMRIEIVGPTGKKLVENVTSMDTDKAQWFEFAGKRRETGGWPSGIYTGTCTVQRGGEPVVSRAVVARL